MSKKIRIVLIALTVVIILFIVCGFLLNLIFKRISYSFYITAERNTETDENIRRLEIGENASLIGFAKSTDYSEPRKTILYFGGSGDIAYNAVFGKAELFKDYVFISVDYPGTQESVGKMNLASMQWSALQVYDYAVSLEYVDAQNIFVLGVSYGTGMAAYLASERDCRKLILIAPYRDIKDLYNEIIPIFNSPFGWFITDNIDTKKYAESVNSSTLIVTSDGDKTIDRSICYSLSGYFAHATVFEVDNVAHNDLLRNKDVLAAIYSFMDE